MPAEEKDRLVAWNRELIAAHDRLREALRIAQRSGRDGTATSHRDLLLYCHGFCQALTGHHLGEDTTLFPGLMAQQPELAETIAQLEQDHTMIATLVEQLEAVLSTGGASEEVADRLEGIAAIMESHFRYEERRLSGVLATLRLDDDVTTVLGPL